MEQVIRVARHESHRLTDWKAGVWAGVIAGLVFPWFEMGRNWIGAFSHVMFGAVPGFATA